MLLLLAVMMENKIEVKEVHNNKLVKLDINKLVYKDSSYVNLKVKNKIKISS